MPNQRSACGGGLVAMRMTLGLKSTPVKAASQWAMVTRRRRIAFFAGSRAMRFCEWIFGNRPRKSSARRIDSRKYDTAAKARHAAPTSGRPYSVSATPSVPSPKCIIRPM